ncbi:Ataxin-2-like protein [Larimichthys crocea]|uniref:Ataxin-2-like protein n=1 Tax=Larimichthys crocea TaxID=215358 RepID=A0A6G0HU31_LARCR|nr:Ataxin-2-like protein [Larimichthys crocea]
MTCRDVDLSFAVRDTFTDTAISSTRVNGDHREKVLQRWDGNGNGENFELESDASNGWDANEMFKFNEEAYGIKSTYDSSLSMYTGELGGFPTAGGASGSVSQRDREQPAVPRRVSLENEEGRSEEDKYSSVVREREDRASPGFTSTGSVSREGKYIPLPQRAREIGLSGSSMRTGGSGRTAAPSSSSRHPPPSSSSPKPPSDRSSPLSVRTAYSPHNHRAARRQPAALRAPITSCRTPCLIHRRWLTPHARLLTELHPELPRSLRDFRATETCERRTPSPQLQSLVLRNQTPLLRTSPWSALLSWTPPPAAVTTATTTKPSGPTPLFPVDVNEILSAAAKERTEALSSPQEVKSSKAPSVQQRSQQLEELRKFGKEFRCKNGVTPRLQPSSSPSASPASVDPPQHSSASPADSSSSSSSSPAPPKPLTSSTQDLPPTTEAASTSSAQTSTAPVGSQSSGPGTSHSVLGGEEACPESSERVEAASAAAVVQVKNSTLNPNAKEFLPIKGNAVMVTLWSCLHPDSPEEAGGAGGGGGAIYSNPPGHYLSYVSPIHIQGHSIQAPQMYQYTMSTVNQGKYPRAKGPVVGQRPEHHPSPASPMLSAAGSAAGPPLVASPYPQSYLQYGQVIQAMPPHYHGQAVYSMLQGGARMLTSGSSSGDGSSGPSVPGPG